MNTRLFRKVSLERLSSPEQLDQLLRVTSPRRWLALVAIFILLATALVWGYSGRIATTASGQGVIVREGGVLNIVTQGSGLVLNLNVKVGDKVKANQVIGTIAQPVLVEKMKALRESEADAERERARTMQLHQNSARLQIDALERQRANAERQIGELETQAKLAEEQVTVDDQLLEKGLVTKQQTITAKQKLMDLQDQIATHRAQIKQLEAQKFAQQAQPEQEDAELRARVAGLQRDLAGLQKELSLSENVISPYDGEVLELKVSPGSAVTTGQPIVSIQPEAQSLELIAYLPSLQAKNTRPGMEVQVSPSTIKREEYGFMKGKVVYVSGYPATPASLMRNFQNESLVTALTLSGPVTEIRIVLERDPQTPSGFKWSTSRGPQVTVTSGTLCTVQIVTQYQRPISLVVPFVKEKLGLS
jgi:HlyD family secretion protein